MKALLDECLGDTVGPVVDEGKRKVVFIPVVEAQKYPNIFES